VPNTADAIKSFDDLVKSNLPIYVLMFYSVQQGLTASQYFNKTEPKLVVFDPKKVEVSKMVEKDRSDIAYIMKTRKAVELFGNMPYRLLPEVIFTSLLLPVRMNRPSPYEELFVMAMMRSIAAGALDKVSRDFLQRNFRRSVSSVLRRERGAKPLSLDSFDAIFVVWFSGCAIAFLVFVGECWLN